MDYFFETTQSVLTIDEDTRRVGINNPIPSCDLDIAGDLNAGNIDAQHLNTNTISSSNILTNQLLASGITSASVDTFEMNAFDVSACNIHALSNITASNAIVSLKHLGALGTLLKDPCPIPANEGVFGLFPSGGYIDPSWVKVNPDYYKAMDTLWNIAQSGYDLFSLATDFYRYFNPTSNIPQIGDELKNALEDALQNNDESSSNQQLFVSWNNLNDRIVATDKTTKDLGVGGDLYISESKSIYSITSGNLATPSSRNNLSFITKSSRDKLADIGTKEVYLNILNVGSNVKIQHNDKNFKIQDWTFTSNVISNSNSAVSSIQFSTSNNTIGIGGNLNVIGNVSTPLINTEQMVSTAYGSLAFSSSNLKTKYQDPIGNNSYLYQGSGMLEWKTQGSNPLSNISPQISRFSVDSNGTMFVGSNIQTPEILILKATSSNGTGTFTIEPSAMRFYNSNNYIMFSVNSNGTFLNDKFSIYGKPEYLYNDLLGTSFSNFSRLECSIQDGLTYGYGLSNAPLSGNYNALQVSYKGEVKTIDSRTLTMSPITNSNAEIVAPIRVGQFNLSNTGTITIGKLTIVAPGNLYYDNVPVMVGGKIQSTNITGLEALVQSKLEQGVLSFNSLNPSQAINPFQALSSTPLVVI